MLVASSMRHMGHHHALGSDGVTARTRAAKGRLTAPIHAMEAPLPKNFLRKRSQVYQRWRNVVTNARARCRGGSSRWIGSKRLRRPSIAPSQRSKSARERVTGGRLHGNRPLGATVIGIQCVQLPLGG